MARNQYDDDDLELDETGDVNDGSRLVKDLRKQLREMQKQLNELSDENTTLKTSKRSTDLTDLVKSKGLDPKVANLYPKDSDVSAEALDAWLSEYGSVFGVKAPADEETPEPQQDVTDPGFDPTAMAAYRRLQMAESGAQIPGARAGEIAAQIRDAKSAEELNAILRQRV